MKVETRLVYISEDGKEFDSEEVCKRYEKGIVFMRIVFDCIGRYADEFYDTEVKEDIARAIAYRFPELIERYNEL